MKTTTGKLLPAIVIIGIAATCIVGSLMAQTGQSPPTRSDPQYFVTGDEDFAHLWVREGTKLRCLGHGECKAHAGHKQGDEHDHDKDHGKPLAPSPHARN